MKIAVIYATKHGTAEKAAKTIADGMAPHEVSLINIRKNKDVDISTFDRVVIGGSIHAGMIQKGIQKFMAGNEAILLEKPLGLFLCCMYEAEAQNQFDAVFPASLRSHARSCKCVGGEYLFEKMNFLEKAMVRKIAGVEDSVSKIKTDQIMELAQKMVS